MNVIEELIKLGYDGADIHRIFTFFDIKPIIKDPFFPKITELELNRNQDLFNLIKKLVVVKNLKALDNAINYGGMGITVDTKFLVDDYKKLNKDETQNR